MSRSNAVRPPPEVVSPRGRGWDTTQNETGPTTSWAAVVGRAQAVGGPVAVIGRGPVGVGRLVIDSRSVRPGDVYACVRGARTDGHRHVADALAAGAAGLVVDRPDRLPAAVLDGGAPVLVVPSVRAVLGPVGALLAGDPATRMELVTVTGSNGKTTTSTLLRSVLGCRAGGCGSISTVGAEFGGELRTTALTTPEAPEVHRLLDWMLERGASAAVVEASSIALDVGRLDGLVADVAVFTGFEEDHLDHHGTVEQYWASKARLFEPDRAAAAVVVTDDPWGRRLADQATVPVTRVGHDHDCDVRVLDWRTGAEGTHVWLGHDGRRHHVWAAVVGAVNVTNVAAAWAAGRRLGIGAEELMAGLRAAPPPEGRNTLIQDVGGPLVVVDHAHTPRALAAAVAGVRALRPAGRVHLVLGARGARDRWKRQGLGVSARSADVVWSTNEGSHGEDPDAIVDELRLGLMASDAHVRTEIDRPTAITSAVAAADVCDVVLVVGRGHETSIQDAPGEARAETAVWFSDVDGARQALRRRRDTAH